MTPDWLKRLARDVGQGGGIAGTAGMVSTLNLRGVWELAVYVAHDLLPGHGLYMRQRTVLLPVDENTDPEEIRRQVRDMSRQFDAEARSE